MQDFLSKLNYVLHDLCKRFFFFNNLIFLFLFQHNRFCAEAREAEPEVLWVGDTLIQDLVNSHIWERHFCQMHSLNFGIAGNRTQHVLWRLQNGELETLAPKVILNLLILSIKNFHA